jgi:hypothetical protein
MPDLSAKSSQELEAAKKRALSQIDGPVQSAEPGLSPAVQRAIAQPARMSPSDLINVQRMAGNRAASVLLSRAAAHMTPVVQREEEEQGEAEEQEDIEIQLPEGDELPADESGDDEDSIVQTKPLPGTGQVQRGFFSWFKKGKGNQSQGPVSETKNVTMTGVTAGSVYSSTTKALDAIHNTAPTGTMAFLGVFQSLGETISHWGILGMLGLIKKIYDVVTAGYDMFALERAKDDMEKKQAANIGPMRESDANLLEATQHGYSKVRRRFWEGVYKLISQIIKVVAHLITVLSGGTAAMVSELVAFGATILEGVVKVVHKVKGFFKWLLNKRGAHRQQSGERIVDSALKKELTALQLLVSLDPMGMIGRQKQALKYGYGDPPKPANTDEMIEFLNTMRFSPDKYGSIEEYKEFVAAKLKSTS